ncbi:MAG: hypothetical protein KAS73_14815 [Candidatus Sabulitectum sp.]|nr:hypothetical protein [Candidatus Sabulitectum sp.]
MPWLNNNLRHFATATCDESGLAFGAHTVKNEVFKEKGNVFRMGRTPIQIDIINHADGERVIERVEPHAWHWYIEKVTK